MAPTYPPVARQARTQGVVILETTIGADGKVKATKVVKSVPMLDDAAQDAVKKWEYQPTIVDGKATADQGKRAKLYESAQKIIHDQALWIPLGYPTAAALTRAPPASPRLRRACLCLCCPGCFPATSPTIFLASCWPPLPLIITHASLLCSLYPAYSADRLNKMWRISYGIGLIPILFMLLCYLMEERSPWWTLGFAFGCLLSSAYGFLQGAWPFGAVELLWTAIAIRRWWVGLRKVRANAEPLA